MATAAPTRPFTARDLTLVKDGWMPHGVRQAVKDYKPTGDLGRIMREMCLELGHRPDLVQAALDRIASVWVFESTLSGLLIPKGGKVEDLGVLSHKVITTTGVTYLCTYLSGAVTGANLKFHGLGTGVGAEASGDTALGTELTTEYAVDNTRPSGTSVASTNTFTSAATNTIDSGTPAVTEHGLFSAASSGTLFDRSKFAAVNLVSGDGLTTTYTFTANAGG